MLSEPIAVNTDDHEYQLAMVSTIQSLGHSDISFHTVETCLVELRVNTHNTLLNELS